MHPDPELNVAYLKPLYREQNEILATLSRFLVVGVIRIDTKGLDS